MSSLFGGRSASLAPQDAQAKAQQIRGEVQQQLALAQAQELINKLNEKCFKACITKPSDTLTPNDQACLMRCSDRFLEAFNIISQTYVQRLAREREAASGANLLPQ
ncbi:mitochondrial import inner membrane translocase subunit TIM13 [Rhodotorula toruloides]|uniref:Mitochondrial import inner membrane translocase subunit n=1 Tax=Rhodotorula toruloides TaxID=5286 RepID=A0A511KNR4_RHOTO|nr:mitochondrial import inner membrane translocase subunit TIM13 [Rhodotorula toruloides]